MMSSTGDWSARGGPAVAQAGAAGPAAAAKAAIGAKIATATTATTIAMRLAPCREGCWMPAAAMASMIMMIMAVLMMHLLSWLAFAAGAAAASAASVLLIVTPVFPRDAAPLSRDFSGGARPSFSRRHASFFHRGQGARAAFFSNRVGPLALGSRPSRAALAALPRPRRATARAGILSGAARAGARALSGGRSWRLSRGGPRCSTRAPLSARAFVFRADVPARLPERVQRAPALGFRRRGLPLPTRRRRREFPAANRGLSAAAASLR